MVVLRNTGTSPHLRRALIGAGAAVGATLGPVAIAHAETITVTSLADDGGGASTTLREAVEQANTGAPDADSIVFQSGLTGTITLEDGVLELTDSVTITGPGSGSLTISGNGDSNVFASYDDTHPANIDITLSGMTITDGHSTFYGGAVYLDGDVDTTISNSTISNSSVGEAGVTEQVGGGGIIAQGTFDGTGSLKITNSVISGNTATGGNFSYGGGIFIYQLGDVTIQNSRITGNTMTTGSGGGGGGGIGTWRYSDEYSLNITNSTIDGNSTTGSGGGFYAYGGYTTISNSTISGNSAKTGGGVELFNRQGYESVTLGQINSSTIAGNSSTGNGGGIWRNTNVRPTLNNSIVADNTAAGSGTTPTANVQGQWTGAFNLIETVPQNFTQSVPNSNVTGVDPKLGPLQVNISGQPTQKPALDSPALDKASAGGTDQRGKTRPFDIPTIANSAAPGGNAADIGSVELTLAETVPNTAPTAAFHFSPGSPVVGQTVTFTSDSTDSDGSIANVAWDFDDDGQFDDGSTSPADFTFGTAGPHEVNLRVTDDGGATADITKVVTVSPANVAPTAAFHFAPADPEVGEQVTFTSDSTDSDGTIASVSWDLDGNGTFGDSTTNPATTTFNTTGTKTVSLRVTDDDGSTAEVSHTVTVSAANVAPMAAFHFSPASPQTGEVVTFTSDSTDSDGDIDTYAWDLDDDGQFDDGSANTATTTFATAGNHDVALRVTDDDGATADVTHTVAVTEAPPGNNPPTAAFHFSPQNPVTGQEVTFDSDSSDSDGIFTLSWDLDDNGVFGDSTDDEAVHTFTAPGAHEVTLRVTDNDNASVEVSHTVIVTQANQSPSAAFHYTPASPKAGDIVEFESDSDDADGTIASIAWDLDGDGAFNDGTEATTSRVFPAAGTYDVTIRVTDDDGATDAETQTVTVGAAAPGNEPPVSSFDFSPANPVAGQTVTFTSTASDEDGSIASFSWDLDGNGLFGEQPGAAATRAFPAAGVYPISLRVTDDDGASADVTQNVTVSAPAGGGPGPGPGPGPAVDPFAAYNAAKKKCKKKHKKKAKKKCRKKAKKLLPK